MKAVIMAGGEGSRLRPLTCDLPKPMVPVANYPVLEYIINLLKRHNITEIAITTFYLPGMLEDYFGDGQRWGVKLKYYLEEEPLGTAGSVHNAADFLDETFLVISGDGITDFDLDKGISFHQEKKAAATLLLAQEEIPLDYGVVMTDQDGRVIRFLEKPDWGQVFSDTINTGIYLLEPEIFNLYPKGRKFDFSRDLFPLMLEKGKGIYGVTLKGYWNDIGSLAAYHQTQFDLMAGKINLPLQACGVIDHNIWVEDGVEIEQSAVLKGPLYIGAGSMIAAGVCLEESVIGKNCYINSHTSIKKSILWDNNTIGAHVEIRGAILANNVIVQDRAAIFDQAVVGKKVVIGRESRLKPGIKIWPEKEIEERAEVESSIVWPTHWTRHLFSNRGIIGQTNIEITPEFVASIAVSFGSTLKRGDEIVVSSDNYKVSNALKRALIGGLQAAGIKVIDVGNCPTAVTRYCVAKMKSKGAVQIRISYLDPEKTVLEFLDEQGVHLSGDQQKAIEKKYFTKDFNRVQLEHIGGYVLAPEMNRNYLEGLLASVNQGEIKRNSFRIVVDYEHDSLGELLPLLFKRLNCQLISTRNYSAAHLPLSLANRLEAQARIARIMADQQADLGIILDHNGEKLHLLGKDGQVLNQTSYQVLISYILLEKGLKRLYLPVNSPRAIETMAAGYGAAVEYTPLNWQVSMSKYYRQDKTNQGIFAFYPYWDGIAGLALILEKLAREKTDFGQLLNRLPEFYLNNAEISCSWKDKGRVMRQLSKQADYALEKIDGIKFDHSPRGWALVVPDGERTVFHVFAEGEDLETAESLTGFYLNKLKEMIRE